MQDGAKGADSLFSSMKELRGEGRQHERVFGYYGALLAALSGLSKETGAAVTGLGVALASGMWVGAAVEVARLRKSFCGLIAAEGKSVEATQKLLDEAIAKTKQWNEETRRAILMAQGLTGKQIDAQDEAARYAAKSPRSISAPEALTDPDVRDSRIRLFDPRLRYAYMLCTTLGRNSGYRLRSASPRRCSPVITMLRPASAPFSSPSM